MKLSKKQLDQLQEIDAILSDSNLTLKLVSFDDTIFMLALHRINSFMPSTYNITSIQLCTLDSDKLIKSYTSVSYCLKNLCIFKDLFIFKNLGSL